MRATVLRDAYDVQLEELPDPVLSTGGDALVRVVAACVCGSDLWRYRGIVAVDGPKRIGHEFVGVVEDVGPEVRRVKVGDFVVAPFVYSCGECANCRNGITTSCLIGGAWGEQDRVGGFADGGQGELVRVPLADGTLKTVPGRPEGELIPSLLALSDVFPTGYHAAVSAGVGPGKTVVVVGDGAVGLSAVLAASRLGAARIVGMSRHPDRQALAYEFGATDVVEQRGEEGVAIVRGIFDGIGPDCVLEAVGTEESWQQALGSVRPGGTIGYVGAPYGVAALPIRRLFNANIGLRGGIAPVRAYLDELVPQVLAGEFNPGRVFDLELPLDQIAQAYAAMDERRAIKVMLRP